MNGRTLDTYVLKFQWDSQKYNAGGFVRDISGEISQKLTAIEGELKSRMQAYNKVGAGGEIKICFCKVDCAYAICKILVFILK